MVFLETCISSCKYQSVEQDKPSKLTDLAISPITNDQRNISDILLPQYVVVDMDTMMNVDDFRFLKRHPDYHRERSKYRTKWTVHVSSVHQNAVGSRLINGNMIAPWHSAVGDGTPWAIINFREVKTISGILFTGHQGMHASPKHIIFLISDDRKNWKTLLDIAELPNWRTTQTLNAFTPQTGRYLKIDIRSTWSGALYSYIGNIDIIFNHEQNNLLRNH